MNDAVSQAPEGDRSDWRPQPLDPQRSEDRERIARLIADGITTYDTLDEQLADYIATCHPDRAVTQDECAVLASGLRGERTHTEYGVWMHFPWVPRLVRILPRAAYRALRGDRNRDKITSGEQDRLRQATIGIVGLSVGAATAVTLALEGVGGRFRLADFDSLALSNLNRLRAGCHELGVNKAVLAARHMAEIDPYLDIEIFPDGVRDDTLDAFFGPPDDQIDLLIEECDSFDMKLRLREAARARGIPVIMDTNDRGLIDIERFDLDPTRPLLHGLLGDIGVEELARMGRDERVAAMLKFLDGERMSPRLKQSMRQIGRTLSTWPQLASDVALGAALLTDVARRILLDELRVSGRYSIDISALIPPL